jgi:superfamily II DNA/RNA helicase
VNAIIFCNRKVDVDAVAKSLKKHGYDAAPIHGDLDQSQRTKTLDQFRAGELRFLCASDVAARGLDVPSVSHVFNFDVPSHAEDYVHRIGRTGRAGREGKAMMICVPRDEKNFEDIERLLQKAIPRLANPLGNDAPAPKEVKQDIAPKEAKADTTKKPREDKPKRTRNRTRKSEAAPTPVEAVIVAEVTPDVVVEAAPVVETAPAAEPTQNRTRGGRGRNNNDRNDNDRNSNGRKNDRNNDRGSKVAGLGEHTPTFIGKSFAERYDK